MGPPMHDLQPSTKWAIANVESKGVLFMSGTIFDLVNLNSGRAHRLRVSSGGVSQGLGKYFPKANLPFSYSPESSMSNYGYFSTYRHVSFDDFDGVGARIIGARVALWAWCSLTLWDGPAYISRGLAFARTSGWGFSTPAVSLDHGVAEIVYDDGVFLGLPDPLPIDISDPPTPTRLHKSVQIVSSNDEFVVILGGDTLFDFDKSQRRGRVDGDRSICCCYRYLAPCEIDSSYQWVYRQCWYGCLQRCIIGASRRRRR